MEKEIINTYKLLLCPMNLHALSYLILNSENYTHFTDEQIDGDGLQHGLLV